VDFVNGQLAAPRIAGCSQALVGILGNLVLRVLAIQSPGQSDVSGAGEAGKFIDVAAGSRRSTRLCPAK